MELRTVRPPSPFRTLREYLDKASKTYCRAVLWYHKGHITNAAKALGIHRNTLTKILNRSRKEKP